MFLCSTRPVFEWSNTINNATINIKWIRRNKNDPRERYDHAFQRLGAEPAFKMDVMVELELKLTSIWYLLDIIA